MIHVKILLVGKTKEAWLEEAIGEYLKRLSPYVHFDFLLFKDEKLLEAALAKEKNVIVLDPEGKRMTSPLFADWLFTQFERGASHVAFAIGGPEGFSEEVKTKYPLLSLSSLTFTHQMTRLILLEQIFRAFEIKKGSHYHK